ncbi:4'-phosphopantetheinyl transferase family protein [Methylomonas albis]|uniref:4'-phosphopantetheinyl transferase superfamily protein n=1 Tax=Methylomonas albis TaxID=1854563 RepID=A0ABR9D4G8_9GAMM|nr:4'-phosphopantetheinyl transferase superfamily protein [Methylomonas albis]MBD9358025.1 4'-phosphopantetheinyl transferase superfamily protein [Methylomonas albis]
MFTYGPYGKPALTGADAVWKFNMAHSQHIGLIAVSRDIEIGVDVEIDRPIPDLAGLIALCFSNQQRNACLTRSKPQQLLEFYRTWTCKEALLKASGEGLQIDLPDLEIGEDGTVLRWPAKLQAYSRYRVYPLPQIKIPAALALGPELTDWQCEEFPLHALERLFDHDVNRGKLYV